MSDLLARLQPAAQDHVVDLELVLEALDRIPTLSSDLTAILLGAGTAPIRPSLGSKGSGHGFATTSVDVYVRK